MSAVAGWERLSDAAAEAVVWALIHDVAKEHKDAARAYLTNRMSADAAAVKAIANGETIGRVNWVDGKSAPAVVDTDKFIEYVGAHHPGELIVTVNSAFQRALFAKLKVVDDIAIDANGEPVPGVAVRESAPCVSVRKSDEARSIVEQLLSGGRLGIDGIRQPELPQEQEADHDPRSFPALNEVTMYQARCTSCGVIEDDYGDFSAWDDPGIPIAWVQDNGGWLRVGDDWPPVELLCPKCQHCTVCGAQPCFPHDDGQHAVCVDHEGHDFSAAGA